jgi:ABC-type oligopeptide transport system substrate-binding subunit
LDPHRISGIPEQTLSIALFEGLFGFEPRDLTPVLAAAKDYRVSADGKRYTFELLDGLRWSDGTPLGAEDFVYAWRRALEPKTASPMAYLMYDIVGAEPFNQGRTSRRCWSTTSSFRFPGM